MTVPNTFANQSTALPLSQLDANFAALGDSTNVSFLQSGTGAVARTVQDKGRDVVSVFDFMTEAQKADVRARTNAVDVTAAISACVTACIAAGVVGIYNPSGLYRLTDEIVATAPVNFYGAGDKKTVYIQSGATKNGINFNYPSLALGGGVSGMAIEAGAGYYATNFQGSGSTGTGLLVQNAGDTFIAENFSVHNFDTSLQVLGCYYAHFHKFDFLYHTTCGIKVTTGLATGAGNFFSHGKVSNFGFTGINTASVGILLIDSGGEFFDHIDVTSQNEPVKVAPTAGKQVLYGFFDTILADTGVSNNWTFDGALGNVWSMQCHNCWGSFSTNGAGLVTKGASLDSVRWIGGRLRENGTQGWSHQGGINCEVQGAEIASNSKLTNNTYDGVLVAANVSSWSIIGCRIGNFASSLTGQANGIAIAAGASGAFRIIGNDLSNPGAGKVSLSNGTSTQSYLILGNIPIQSGVNSTRGDLPAGCTVGTVAAAATVYLGSNAAQATELDSAYQIAKPGYISQIIVRTDAAPGAAKNFTYMLRVNGADTAMTGAISGAASQIVVISGGVLVANADYVTLRLVTDAAANLARHRWSMAIDS